MKDLVSKVKSFVTFELPLQPAYIREKFAHRHEQFKLEDPDWTVAATRQKLISSYWLKVVPLHFATVLAISLIALSIIDDLHLTEKLIAVLVMVVLISYLVLLAFHYAPNFFYNYLPHLENAKEVYEGKQNEKLEKCRQAQLPNFSLTLLFYVFAQMNDIEILRNDERISLLLMKIFGVDPGSIKKNLDLLISPPGFSKISERKKTEIRNRFNDVYQVLEELNIKEAINRLRTIESRTVEI